MVWPRRAPSVLMTQRNAALSQRWQETDHCQPIHGFAEGFRHVTTDCQNRPLSST